MASVNVDYNKIKQMGPTYFEDPSIYKRTSKKRYSVYVCMPRPGQKVVNRLEMAKYVTDENKKFVISGTVGETWVIDVAKLAKTYQYPDGTPITPESLNKKVKKQGEVSMIDWFQLVTQPGGGGINWATFVPKEFSFPIKTSWGDTLMVNDPRTEHGLGDFLVCDDAGGRPNLADRWVVNGKVFPTTYDMRPFPGLGGGQAEETLKPKSIFTSSRGAKRASYQMTGRYLNGTEVTSYHLQNLEGGSSGKFSREQVYYLVGRGQVTNCIGRLGPNGTVQLAGRGMKITDLPTQQEDGRINNTEAVGKIRRGETGAAVMDKLTIIAQVPEGRRVVAYWLQNAGKGRIIKSREEVIELAKKNMISNARVQNNNGKILLRAKTGCEINKLPAVDREGKPVNN